MIGFGVESAALVGAALLRFIMTTVHTPVDTAAAPDAPLDIAVAPAPCAEMLAGDHAARANMAQSHGPGVVVSALTMVLSVTEAVLPGCCAPVRASPFHTGLASGILLQ